MRRSTGVDSRARSSFRHLVGLRAGLGALLLASMLSLSAGAWSPAAGGPDAETLAAKVSAGEPNGNGGEDQNEGEDKDNCITPQGMLTELPGVSGTYSGTFEMSISYPSGALLTEQLAWRETLDGETGCWKLDADAGSSSFGGTAHQNYACRYALAPKGGLLLLLSQTTIGQRQDRLNDMAPSLGDLPPTAVAGKTNTLYVGEKIPNYTLLTDSTPTTPTCAGRPGPIAGLKGPDCHVQLGSDYLAFPDKPGDTVRRDDCKFTQSSPEGPGQGDVVSNEVLDQLVSLCNCGGYVALGDSYSSGEGNPPFTEEACDRSVTSYPEFVQKIVKFPSFTFEACSGATAKGLLAQINAVGSEQAETARLVTFTIGGNDLDFEGIIRLCAEAHILHRTRCTADKPGDKPYEGGAEPLYYSGFRMLVKQFVPDLQAALSKFPSAEIMVVGYPWIFPPTSPNDCAALRAVGVRIPKGVTGVFASADIPELHLFIIHLNGWLNTEVIFMKTPRVVFVDPNENEPNLPTPFLVHNACSGQSWFTDVYWGTRERWSLHPTQPGQHAMASAVLQQFAPDGGLTW